MAVACMGVGIGVCTTLFNAVNPWLFRPLPYPASQRLVGLRETAPLREGRTDEGDSLASAANYVEWRERSRSFESLGAFERTEANLATADEPERVHAARVTASLFPTLRIPPVVGRGFTSDEDEPGGRPVAIVGHRLWQRRSGGDQDGLGGTIKLDGVVHTVVGVMPPGFAFPEYAEVWTPLRLARAGSRTRRARPRRRGPARGRRHRRAGPQRARRHRAGARARASRREPGARGRGQAAPRLADAARRRGGPEAAPRRRPLRPAHRLRERGQPAPGEGRGPAPGDRDARGARRFPGPPPATVHGRDAPGDDRRRRPGPPGRHLGGPAS